MSAFNGKKITFRLPHTAGKYLRFLIITFVLCIGIVPL